jgi:hypothetical protein
MSTRATRDITVTRNTMDITRTTARRVVTTEASTGGTAVVITKSIIIPLYNYDVVKIAIFLVVFLTPTACPWEQLT